MGSRTLIGFGVGVSIGLVLPFTGLGDRVTSLFLNKATQREAVETLNLENRSGLYDLPEGYVTSQLNLRDLFILAGYDAGSTIDPNEGGVWFDPNTQKDELSKTCQKTDQEPKDKIITGQETKERLRDEYDWDPIDL